MYRDIARRCAAICCFVAPFGYAQASLAGGSDAPGAAIRVQVLSSSQMQQPDAAVLESRQGDVGKAAELYGYEISEGTWLRNEVVCPEVSKYLLMHYVKIAHDGGVSLFTAVIPRAEGRVRIVPVLYHGAQALRVLGSSPEQREWINEVMPAKNIGGGPNSNYDWSTLASCYAALGGAEPSSTSVISPEETKPTLILSDEGKILGMSFSVVGADYLFQNWTVYFDRNGGVKSIAMWAEPLRPPGIAQAAVLKTTEVPQGAGKAHLIPEQGDSKTRVIPDKAEVKTHVIPNSP